MQKKPESNASETSGEANVAQWNNFAGDYDRFRPEPPGELVTLLMQLARVDRPLLVVDLGCGTGLATRIWEKHAAQVIGIEPNDEMRTHAETQTEASHVSYRPGYGHDTGLPAGCADIVTAAHSLHWMEPESTVAEIDRILRPGGVFAQVDFKWPPATDWEIDAAILRAKQLRDAIADELKIGNLRRYSTSEHFDLLRSKHAIRYTNELVMTGIQQGNAYELMELLKTSTDFRRLLQQGVGEDDLGLNEVAQIAQRIMGDGSMTWFLYFRVRVAVK